jgi:hypothetical protein
MRLQRSLALCAVLAAPLAPVAVAPAEAAISIIQSKSDAGNDVVVTFASAPSASNCVFVLAMMENITQTITIEDWTPAETQLGLVTGSQFRTYLFGMAGDGADNSFIAQTVAGAIAHVFAVEVSGADGCGTAVDDAEDDELASADPWALVTDLTTTQAGDLLLSLAADNTDPFTLNSSNGTLIEDVTSIAVGQYQVVAGAGDYDTTFDWAANESGHLFAFAIKAAAVVVGAPIGQQSQSGHGR